MPPQVNHATMTQPVAKMSQVQTSQNASHDRSLTPRVAAHAVPATKTIVHASGHATVIQVIHVSVRSNSRVKPSFRIHAGGCPRAAAAASSRKSRSLGGSSSRYGPRKSMRSRLNLRPPPVTSDTPT